MAQFHAINAIRLPRAFTDQLPTSIGIHHAFGRRNAPTILNALFNTLQFWDGRAPTLEAQIEGPIVNPVKMGNKSLSDVMAKVKGKHVVEKDLRFPGAGDVCTVRR